MSSPSSPLRRCLVLLIGIELVTSRPALAAWPQDPALNVPVCTAASDQDFPWLVSDEHGGAIICWQDGRLGYPQIGVFAQRMNASGVPQWTLDGVSLSASSREKAYPLLIGDGAGGAIAVWSESPTTGDFPDVYAQHIDAAGALLWGPTGVLVCAAPWGQFPSAIVQDGSRGAIVAWRDGRDFTFQVYVQRLSASGERLWNPSGVALTSTVTGGQATFVGMVSDGSGGAVLSWEDSRNYFGDIYVQRVGPDGNALWTPNGVALTSHFAHQSFPSIVSDNSGGAIVTWQDERTGYTDIYAGRLSAEGILRWPVNGVPVCVASGYQWSPKLAADGSGGAIIAWEDDRNAGYTGRDIYLQHVDGNGAGTWTSNGVLVCGNASWQYGPDLARDGAGGALIAWGDQRNGTNDIFAQRISVAGQIQWETDGIPVSIAPGDQSAYPRMVSDGLGGAIVAWSDRRKETETDIYADHIGEIDTEPPSLEVTPSLALLWPPNHRLIEIRVNVVAEDASGDIPTVKLLSVSSNEPDASSDPEDLQGDIQGADLGEADFELALRAERDGEGSGRVYEICYEARDGSGNAVVQCADVRVPHDRRGRATLTFSGEAWRLTLHSDYPFSAHSVAVETIRLWSDIAGYMSPVPGSDEYGDRDGDGADDLTVRIDAGAGDVGAITWGSCVARWEAEGLGYQALVATDVTGVADGNLSFAAGVAKNPAQRYATIQFSLPSGGEVDLSVYDVTGQRVARLAHGWRPVGRHQELFHGSRSHGPQVYCYRLDWRGRRVTGKFVLFP